MSEQTHIEGTVEFLKHTAEYEGIKSQLIITGARIGPSGTRKWR